MDALDGIIEETRGYPYFLQVWGKHVWDVATDSSITLADVESASESAMVPLFEGFMCRIMPGEDWRRL